MHFWREREVGGVCHHHHLHHHLHHHHLLPSFVFSPPPRSNSISPMSSVSEITDLLAKLASNLKTLDSRTPNGEKDLDCELSISKLNQSLNLRNSSRALDAALSLMCFKVPRVFDSVIEFEVKTMVSVLSSLVVCKVLRFEKQEVLQVGSLITRRDYLELIGALADLLENLKSYGILFDALSYVVLRLSVLASCCQYRAPLIPVLDIESNVGGSSTVSKLLRFLPKDFSIKNREIPSRLLLWYLDPLILKRDVAKIMKEASERPFICLNKEFHDRTDWHSVITSLALSPSMFIQTRALLHDWFLMTGLASIMELLAELVWLIIDVIFRPSWWGLTTEIFAVLPFSSAYFPSTHCLLRTLAGPISPESFLCLVEIVVKSNFLHSNATGQAIAQDEMKIARIDYKSKWALAMNFPDWFLFACVLLFSDQSFVHSIAATCILGKRKMEQSEDMTPSYLSAVAARYITWIMSPCSETHQCLLVDCLTKVSRSWALKQAASGKHGKREAGYKKKLKKHRLHSSKDEDTLVVETTKLWLKEFQDIQTRGWCTSVNVSASCKPKSSHVLSPQNNGLFRRIPLGILIGASQYIDEDGCEVLLHFAVTGIVLKPRITQSGQLKHGKQQTQGHEDIMCTISRDIKEAVAGACLIFSLTDAANRMSASMFETEECAQEFVFQLKRRTRKYLLNCVKKLLEQEDGVIMLKDLYSRLVHWRRQGRDWNNKDLEDVISALHKKVSSLGGS